MTEQRFIRKIGVDKTYSEARADKVVDSDDWDDSVPAWAMVAKSTQGVEMTNEDNINSINKFSAHNKPALGFNLASELSTVGAWHSNDLDEFSGMKYEATLMGERITQLYLDPLSASIIRTGLRRAIRRIVKAIAPVTNFGLLHLATSTPDFTSLWAKN